jgi:hypothetical protein
MRKRVKTILIIAMFLAAAGCESRETTRPPEPNDGKVVSEWVRFIPLGLMGYAAALEGPQTRKAVQREIFKQDLFNDQVLEKGAFYFTHLKHPNDPRSAVILQSRKEKWVVVEAYDWDWARRKVKRRYGLIPYRDYDEYLKGIGK